MDLGCGSGRFLDVLTGRCAEVVDASARRVDLARTRFPSAGCEVGDLWEATLERLGVFGLVHSVDTLHHLGPDPAAYPARACGGWSGPAARS